MLPAACMSTTPSTWQREDCDTKPPGRLEVCIIARSKAFASQGLRMIEAAEKSRQAALFGSLVASAVAEDGVAHAKRRVGRHWRLASASVGHRLLPPARSGFREV
jgi:hypothetical protein